MKTVLRLHALIFCLFLFAFTTSTLAKDLLDVDGKLLENGGLYYIIPASKGKGGGLELAKTGNETCPLTVVQAPSEKSKGLPARLTALPLIPVLSPGFLVAIEFEQQKQSTCLPSRLWWKVEKESRTVKIAAGEEEKLFLLFKVQPYRDDYKLVYCDPKSEFHRDCKDLGISIDDKNNRRLVVKNGDPLVVRFVKADRRGDYARWSIF